MKMRPRIHYTEEQKALMWDRWHKGESPKMNKNHSFKHLHVFFGSRRLDKDKALTI